jgi:cold shock CspA family protein
MTGRIQKYNELKGWGWIFVDFKTRLFFHISNWKIDAPPVVGLHVSFDVAPPKNPNKPEQQRQAVNIVVVEEVSL